MEKQFINFNISALAISSSLVKVGRYLAFSISEILFLLSLTFSANFSFDQPL